MRCQLCPRRCRLAEGQTGHCRARKASGGVTVPLNYGRLTSLALDPIEKKPLYHFHPGSYILSVGSFGCNLRCPFCQNHEISMAGDGELRTRDLDPAALTALALRLKAEPSGNLGVAFTYNEPLISFEYVRDCAALLREADLEVVLVTNGQINPAPLEELLPLVSALNIDLKGFTQRVYDYVGGSLKAARHSIERCLESTHVEVTTLIVPGLNDDPAVMREEAAWLSSLSPELPLHLSRFFPRYQLSDQPPTPRATLLELCQVARTSLRHVYPGNLH